MKPELSQQSVDGPVYDPDCETVYSIEVMAELAGVDAQTVLHYHELGVISPATAGLEFDTDGLRRLRRIEYLRHVHQLNDSNLKFISDLLLEVERLREQLRQSQSLRWHGSL
ncbi:MAG: MerR family regulatory protein [Verrucomicrobiota bacterium]